MIKDPFRNQGEQILFKEGGNFGGDYLYYVKSSSLM